MKIAKFNPLGAVRGLCHQPKHSVRVSDEPKSEEPTVHTGASVLPFGGFYMQWNSPIWSDFQNAIATDTSTWHMPLAVNVNPRPPNSIYFLYSWRNAPQDSGYGHYVPLRGYAGFTQSSALAYYSDSSGGQDDFGVGMYGGTGQFSDLSHTVWETMMLKYGNLVW